jgi:uncharacterized membrane protein
MISYYLVILFAIIGFIIATTIRHKKKIGQPMVCPLGSDCNSVIYSSYSKFFGVDVVTTGLVYYGVIGSLYAYFVLFPQSIPDYLYVIGFLLTVIAVIFSIYLIIVQTLVIREICFWCMLSALVSLGLLMASGFALGPSLPALLLEYKTIIVILHALAAALGVGTVLVTDIFFMKFLKDYRISQGESEILDTLSQVVWFALGMLILTGIALFIPASAELLLKTKFLAKVVIVGVVVVNGVLLNLLIAPKLIKISFGEILVKESGQMHHLRRLAFAFGAVSIVSWLATFILGSLRALPFSTLEILLGYMGIILIAVIGSQLFDYQLNHPKKQ